jgi:hypothetical protein
VTSRVAVSAASCTSGSRHLPFSDNDHGLASIDKARAIQGLVIIPSTRVRDQVHKGTRLIVPGGIPIQINLVRTHDLHGRSPHFSSPAGGIRC